MLLVIFTFLSSLGSDLLITILNPSFIYCFSFIAWMFISLFICINLCSLSLYYFNWHSINFSLNSICSFLFCCCLLFLSLSLSLSSSFSFLISCFNFISYANSSLNYCLFSSAFSNLCCISCSFLSKSDSSVFLLDCCLTSFWRFSFRWYFHESCKSSYLCFYTLLTYLCYLLVVDWLFIDAIRISSNQIWVSPVWALAPS